MVRRQHDLRESSSWEEITFSSGAKVLIKCIQNEGGRFIAGIPGEQVLGVLDALYDVQDEHSNEG
ncbi:hypothetical protein CW709_05400 [Candidatus Bathyarchaeota archaeon]|nr:MAG: hypothetical protein CW709_05400 [Candidatus Bathyarchaeota archaeon]